MVALRDLFRGCGLQPISKRGTHVQSITVGYGKATFPGASITLSGFVVEPPFIRTLASKALTKQGSTVRIPVSDHADIDGWLFNDTVLVPDGTIMMVQMSQKYRGSGLRDGAIFVRAREEGAAAMITATIPSHARSTLTSNTHQVFLGNGDILTVEELAEQGIAPNDSFVRAFMDPEEVEECFNIRFLRGAVSAPPVEEKHIGRDGEVVRLRVEQSPRRIRIRR